MLNYIPSQLQKRQLLLFGALAILILIGIVVSLGWLGANILQRGGIGPGAKSSVTNLLIKAGLNEQCAGTLLNYVVSLYMLFLVLLTIALLVSVIGKKASWFAFVAEALTGLSAIVFNVFSINQVFWLGVVMLVFGVFTLCAMYKAGQNEGSAIKWFDRLNSRKAAQIGTDNAIYPLLFFMLMLLLLVPGGTSLVGDVSETFLALLLVSQPIKLWESVTADESASRALEDVQQRIFDLQKSNAQLEQNLKHLEDCMNSLNEESRRVHDETTRPAMRPPDMRREGSARRTFLSGLLALLGIH